MFSVTGLEEFLLWTKHVKKNPVFSMDNLWMPPQADHTTRGPASESAVIYGECKVSNGSVSDGVSFLSSHMFHETTSETHNMDNEHGTDRGTTSETSYIKSGHEGLEDCVHPTSALPLVEESPRLSAISLSSGNDRMSIVTTLSTDLSDSDRPMSLISTTSSDSLPNNHYPYENRTGANMTQSLTNHFQDQKTDLDSNAVGALKKDSQCIEAVAVSKVSQMHNNNNNASNRRSSRGSGSHSPFSTKVSVTTHKLSYVERVVVEIVETERMYVRDLRSIVEDYLGAIIDTPDIPIKPEQVSDLFGNIEDIYELNSELLQDLDSCENDPVAVARCFVEKSQYFDIYTQYCTNYPNSVAALTDCMRSKLLAKFFRDRQEMLKHSLPLGSYLLKPVQRILKYHLLLQEIAKHFDMEEDGYEVVEEAIGTMTGVAWYINDMKRKHEHAVRLQEIQSLLLNWKGLDLTTYGELVLEGTFRIQRARNERTLFLFYKALFITKKRGDHFVYKTHIPCSSLMLIESTRDSLCFTITHYKNSKQQHTIQVRTVEEKRLWTHHIKELILENHHAIIPQKAKEAILEMDALYPSRYKYSPERVKKIMPTDDPAAQSRQGRRQSEPPKSILTHFGDKPVLKHADSDGALLDIGDPLKFSVGSLVSSLSQSETPEEDVEEEVSAKKQPPKPITQNGSSAKDTGAELTASDEEYEEEEEEEDDDDEEDEEVLMGDDQSKETGELELPKGLKRQKSQSSDKVEKRQSVDVQSSEKAPTDFEPVVVQEFPPEEPPPEHPQVEETPCYFMPTDPKEAAVRTQPDDVESKHGAEQMETENGEDLRALSSEEEEVLPTQEPESILPPSVLDQASIIAERFINSLSRRGSLALDDGKYIGCLTPRLSSRSGSTKSLDCIDKPHFHTSSSEAPYCASPREMQIDSGGVFSPLNGAGSPSLQSPSEIDRLVFKRKDSTLSKQDKLLLDKIRGYYDHAENHDIAFSIKRRESLSYIPSGLVRNSVFKFNSLPRTEPKVETNVNRRINGSSSNRNGSSSSRPASWAHSDVPVSNNEEQESSFSHPKKDTSQVRSAEFIDQLPITDDEFKAPSEMFKVWEEMENAHSDYVTERCEPSSRGEAGKTNVTQGNMQNGNNFSMNHENGFDLHEPLHIIEDSDLSTITEESPAPSPESTSPGQALPGKVSRNGSDYSQDYKMDEAIKLHPKILQLVQCADGNITDKMKSKVYQLARKYSQRVKCNKPVVQRSLKELEEDLRKNSIQKEKQTGKLKPALLSLPNYDNVILKEHSSLSPILSCSSAEKPPKRFSFSPSYTSPGTTSPSRSGCRSPLSPAHTEKFHWPDVRELRSKYTSKPVSSSVKSPPVNRSQSVPESIAEHCPADSFNTQNQDRKDPIGRSASMNIGRLSNLPNQGHKERAHHSSIKSEPHTKLSGAVYQNPCLAGSSSEALYSSRLPSHGASEPYYVSAEAPLENDKKVIVMERMYNKDPTEHDDHYVQIRSPTTREKISLKAVIDRCKAYQESDEYRKREDIQEEEDILQDPTNTLSDPKETSLQLLWEKSDQNQENRVKNLRKKFQTLGSNS